MAMRRRAATTKNADEATVHAVETAGPKRGRSTHKDDDKLPTKRSRKACADEGAGASGDALTEIVGVTSAMGLRPSRDAHPGLPARPRPRRTPTEVAAKRTEQEAAATQKRAAETQRRNNLALILATDDTIAENEKRKTVRHQSELVEDDEGRAIADDGPAGDGNNQEAAAEGETKEMLKQAKKRGKERSVLRGVVDEKVKAMLKTTKSSKSGITSGLKKGFRPSSYVTSSKQVEETQGGLNDEEELENEVLGDRSVDDVSILLPANETLSKLTRDPKRSNELVIPLPSSKSQVHAPNKYVKKPPAPPTHSLKEKQPIEKAKAPARLQKSAKAAKTSTRDDDVSMGSDDDRRDTPTKSAELHDLPEWAKSGWNTRFLRTLYHAINASESPLSEFKTDSASGLATINSIVKHAYPAMNHKVTKSDILFIMAIKRANEYKSKVVRKALHVVKLFFEGSHFRDNPSAIVEYCRHALRPNGPAWFASPTPYECTVLRGDPEYIEPDGFLQSTFIIDTSTHFLQLAKNAVMEFGPPCGLFALIMAGLERAFRAYVNTGGLATIERFTQQKYNTIIVTYLKNTKAVSERRWRAILIACNAGGLEKGSDEYENPDISILEQCRGEIYLPSSPA